MNHINSIIPITVLSAVILFIVKETIELIRRYRADKRRIYALRIMLARECERNHAAIRSIRDAALHIKSKVEFPEYSFSVIATPAGHMRFSASHPELGASSHLLRPAQSDLMNRVMLDVAGLDRKLFSKLEAAYDAIVEIRHLRDSLIDYLSTKIDEEDVFFFSFADYAIKELEDAYYSLNELYEICIGRELTEWKLR